MSAAGRTPRRVPGYGFPFRPQGVADLGALPQRLGVQLAPLGKVPRKARRPSRKRAQNEEKNQKICGQTLHTAHLPPRDARLKLLCLYDSTKRKKAVCPQGTPQKNKLGLGRDSTCAGLPGRALGGVENGGRALGFLQAALRGSTRTRAARKTKSGICPARAENHRPGRSDGGDAAV